MAISKLSLASIAAVLGLAPSALAGFSSSASNNVAIYWGQNSAGGASTQERLSYYCSNTEFDIVLLAFMDAISSPTINFASATNDCTAISGTNLYTCPEIEADIKECQQTYGKTVMLSIGGATYSEGGFTSESAAETAAANVWGLFGSNTAYSNRPFGTAVVDGFDFDFESTTSNMQYFANELRSLMDADTSKTYYLSAAPQCPYPDSADNSMLDDSTSFDFINVQFYNNYCELSNFAVGSSTQNDFNFDTWDNWASTTSANKNVKVLLGAPASTGAAGAGYVAPDELAEIIDFCKSYSSFGGVMFWDMSQLWTNTGMLDTTYTALGGSSSSGSSTTTTTAKATTTTAATTTTKQTSTTTTTSGGSSTGVAQWGQCGGNGYTGSTVCASPYTCVETSEWWSQCE